LIGVPKDKPVTPEQQFLLPTLSAVEIYDKETGKYLGQLGGNQYAPDSTNNPYGQYGSKYSADSINNPYGKYGSEYSNDSPNNHYATNLPVIINNDK
jgi:hypothetical protein